MATIFCKKCGESIEIPEGSRSPFITCPKCRSAVQITTQAARPATPAAPAARPPVSSAPRPAPSMPPSSMSATSPGGMPPSAAPGETLPELMKANKKVAGQPCAICARPVALGEQIHNCPSCHSINHDACWKQSGGCTSRSCSAGAKPQRPAPSGFSGGTGNMGGMSGMDEMGGAMASSGPGPSQGSIPCRWCKEPIMRGARKCKHCNEFQRDEDREAQKPNAWVEDEPLSTTDWIGVLCCPLIGFIQGLIYAAQGNPKAKRLMLYSAISMVIGAILRGIGGGK